MTDAVVYVRISQDRAGEGLGVARQEEDARQLARLRGWTVTDVVIENDTSAAGRKARPGFERLLTAVASGEATVVIAWALDRLTRNRRDTVRLIETCQTQGATIALCRGSDLDLSTPAGRLTADLLAAVARSEIETKADRQQRAALQAAEAGRWIGGRRPFGFEPDGMTLRDDEAQAVRDAYQSLLDGVSLRQIAAQWNSAGLLPPQGSRDGSASRWTGSIVSRCLRKPRYAGLGSYKGELTGGEASWPALVDADTWHSAQAVLRDPGRAPTKGNQRLLTGVARCGLCDGPVHAGGGATGLGVYRCASTAGHFSRKRQPADAYVAAVVVERLSRADAQVFAAPAQGGQGHAELVREADGLRQRLDGLSEAYGDGALTLSQLRKGSARIQTTLGEVEARLAAVSPSSQQLRSLVRAEDVAAAWAALTVEAQRQIVDTLLVVRMLPPGRGTRHFDPASVPLEWRVA